MAAVRGKVASAQMGREVGGEAVGSNTQNQWAGADVMVVSAGRMAKAAAREDEGARWAVVVAREVSCVGQVEVEAGEGWMVPVEVRETTEAETDREVTVPVVGRRGLLVKVGAVMLAVSTAMVDNEAAMVKNEALLAAVTVFLVVTVEVEKVVVRGEEHPAVNQVELGREAE